MSGQRSTSLHASIQVARTRLALISLLGWGGLVAASYVIHHHGVPPAATAAPAGVHAGRA
jgi:hypothetical protein